MSYLFTSESVSEGHPDKVADQISDALLDEFLAYDKNSKVACETLVTTGQVVLAGEVKSSAYVDVQDVARNVIEKIGYTKSEYQFEAKSCGVFSSIHEQSGDINRGVEREDPYNQGAGDQGMMFGYATNETENYMPLALDLSHSLLWELAEIRKNENDLMPYLRPDAKSQVTIEYDDNGKPLRIDTIVVSTQHDEFITAKGITQEEADLAMQKKIAEDVKRSEHLNRERERGKNKRDSEHTDSDQRFKRRARVDGPVRAGPPVTTTGLLPCATCGKGHMGECWRRTGACLSCGSMEYRLKECPRRPDLRQAPGRGNVQPLRGGQ